MVERDFLAALRLLIEDGEGVEPVLMLAAESFEFGNEGGGALAGIGIPLGADEGVLGIEVDGLEIGGAGLDDEFHGGAGERRGGGGDELLLGLFPGEVAGFGAGLLAGEFEGLLLDGLAVDGVEKVSNELVDGRAAEFFGDGLFLLLREHALDAGEASGEGGDGIGIGGPHDDFHREVLEGHGGLGDGRAAGGLERLGDAYGIDDDIVGLGGLRSGRGFAQAIVVERAGAAAFHLLEVAAGFHVAHEEQAFERFHVGAGGDHVHGDGDARVVFVAELLEDGLGIFLVLVSDLFAEGGGFAELLADDLDDVVGVGIRLGEDEGFRDLVFAIGAAAVRKDFRQLVAEGLDDLADLGFIDDVAVERLVGIGFVFVLGFPAFGAGELFAFLDEALENGATVLGDLGFDEVDLALDVHTIGHGVLVGVFGNDVLIEEGVGAGVRRGGKTNEEGVEVIQHLPPEIVDRAVAFIDDDEVEVLDGDFFVIDDGEWFLAGGFPFTGVFVFGGFVELLVLEDRIHPLDGGDADLGIFRDVGGVEALDGVEFGELSVVVGWLIGEKLLLGLLAEVAGIDEEEDALDAGVLEQSIDEGDGGEGFASPRCHLDERAGLGLFHGPVELGDGIDLAIPEVEGDEGGKVQQTGAEGFFLREEFAEGFRTVEREDLA